MSAQAQSTAAADAPVGRLEKKRRATRARLLEAAHAVMVEKGVDAATIREITERADVGFGTFYNYFMTKDDLAGGVLDCMIKSVAARNEMLTEHIQPKRPDLAMAMSTRMLIRSAQEDAMWNWWVRRPDILADRLRAGLDPFVQQDIRRAIGLGLFRIEDENIAPVLAMLIWLIVGGMRDMLIGQQPPDADGLIVEAFMRVMGVSRRSAHELAHAQLPPMPPIEIDFSHGDEKTSE